MEQTSLPILIPRASEGSYRNVPFWSRFSIDFLSAGFIRVTAPDGSTTDVALTAALTQDVSLFTMAANSFIHATRIKSRVQGVGTTTLTAKMGVTGADTIFLSSAFDLMAAIADTNLAAKSSPISGNNTVAAIDFVVLLTATVATLDNLSALGFDVWVCLSTLP